MGAKKSKTSKTKRTTNEKALALVAEKLNARAKAKAPKAKRLPGPEKALGAAIAPVPPEKPAPVEKIRPRDPRVPPAGTTLERVYKGKTLFVEVLDRGFRLAGVDYHSATALASAVTGAKAINGMLWLGLSKRPVAATK